MSYHFSKILRHLSFAEAIDHVKAALKAEGFGILTEIDVQGTFKKKLNVDFKKYQILGACNPDFAYKAIQSENKIGVFLPCNVVVQEHENGTVEISVVDPIASMMSVKNKEIEGIAVGVQKKLKQVIESF